MLKKQVMSKPMSRLIGVISDMHGLVRPEALRALKECVYLHTARSKVAGGMFPAMGFGP